MQKEYYKTNCLKYQLMILLGCMAFILLFAGAAMVDTMKDQQQAEKQQNESFESPKQLVEISKQ